MATYCLSKLMLQTDITGLNHNEANNNNKSRSSINNEDSDNDNN